MSSQDNDQDTRVVAVVLISAILLAVGLALGMGIHKVRSGSAAERGSEATSMTADASHSAAGEGQIMAADADPTAAVQGTASEATEAVSGAAAVVDSAAAGATAAAMPVQAASGDEASVVMENGVVKFYFASARSDLPSGALAALGDAIAAGKNGKRLVLSGFHDSTGSAAQNAELARKRAMAVRDALLAAGVAESAMELKKPEVSTGSGSAAEARRVEVTIVE